MNYRDKTVSYATDGSLVNPLEATYAALTGCAGVYAMKACKTLGIPDEGITIFLRPTVHPSNPSMPVRFETTVSFPSRVTQEQRRAILASIEKCAVKGLIQNGDNIEFEVKAAESDPAETGR